MVNYRPTNFKKKEIDYDVVCNMCGKKLEKDKYGYFPDYFHGEMTWGYNSRKDGRRDVFDLCEKCYDNFINGFKIKIK